MDRPSRRPSFAPPPSCRAPIYARLVAEWRARGRTVPARPDVQWVSFADLSPHAWRDEGRIPGP